MPHAQVLDFQALADGVVRANVGVDAITLGVRGRLEGDSAVLHGTGQRLPVTGAQATSEPWLWFDVHGWLAGDSVQLSFLRGEAAPAGPAPGAGAGPPPALK